MVASGASDRCARDLFNDLTSADDLYLFVGLHVARYRHKPWRDHSGDKLAEKCIKRPVPPAG